jgi:hypothetical protein
MKKTPPEEYGAARMRGFKPHSAPGHAAKSPDQGNRLSRSAAAGLRRGVANWTRDAGVSRAWSGCYG